MADKLMEPLLDPLGDRIVKNVTPPPHRPLYSENIFAPAGTDFKDPKAPLFVDWKLIMKNFQKNGRLSKEAAVKLLRTALETFKKEENIVKVPDPVVFVGDIHGQFFDLIKMLDLVGKVGDLNFVFLGDYVDRGMFAFEVVATLYALKLCYPNKITLLRGNHECRQMTENFNFLIEIEEKYDHEIYDLIMETFDALPLAALVDNKILAVHGGISPELQNMQAINKIDRFKEIPRVGLFTDLMWSDPVENETGQLDEVFSKNSKRSCSYLFGNQAANNFLEMNNLLCVVRAHEVQMNGYKLHQWNGPAEFPAVITIFSAPNYCDVYNNKAAVLRFENNQIKIQQYNYTQHPFVLPDNMDVFTWSMPFVSEKVVEILYNILMKGAKEWGISKEEIEQKANSGENILKATNQFNIDVLKSKMGFIGKLMKMQSTLRENHELFMQLKGMCPDKRIPQGLLLASTMEIKDALVHFTKAKQMDSKNEQRPA